MKQLSALLNQNRLFFTTLSIAVISALMVYICFGDIGMATNNRHPFWINVLFVNLTFMADSIFILCGVVLLRYYFKSPALSNAVLVSFILSMLLVQLLKNLIDPSGFRIFFEQGQYIFSLNGMETTTVPHLPSGHTALAFSTVASILFSTGKHRRNVLLVMAATLIAFSRMYLAYQSLLDIVSGMAVGIFGAVAANLLFIFFRSRPIGKVSITLNRQNRHIVYP